MVTASAATVGHGSGHIQAAGQKWYQSRRREGASLVQYEGGSITIWCVEWNRCCKWLGWYTICLNFNLGSLFSSDLGWPRNKSYRYIYIYIYIYRHTYTHPYHANKLMKWCTSPRKLMTSPRRVSSCASGFRPANRHLGNVNGSHDWFPWDDSCTYIYLPWNFNTPTISRYFSKKKLFHANWGIYSHERKKS